MANKRNYDPMARQMAKLQEIVDTRADWANIDERLTEGQMHYLVKEALGQEPLVFAAALLSKAMHKDSKIEISPEVQAKVALLINDRLYGPVTVKSARKPASANQFQLTFAWESSEDADAGEDAREESVG